MATEAYGRLRQFEGRAGVSVQPSGQALELSVARGDVHVTVTVPESVLEWFVDAERSVSGSRASDWTDYERYDKTPRAELERDMADDVQSFVTRLIERDLRYVEDAKNPAQGVLEWFVDGEWRQASPLVGSTS